MFVFFEQLLRLFFHCGRLNFSEVNATILHALFKTIFFPSSENFISK